MKPLRSSSTTDAPGTPPDPDADMPPAPRLQDWVGRQEVREDLLHPTPVQALAATLDHEPTPVPDGTPLKLRMAAKPGSALVDTDAVALPAMRATGGVFGVMYMVDEGDHYTSINQSELEAVGMTLDSLHRLALNNLKKLVQGDQPGLKFQPGPLLKMFMMGGDFESSLVLVDELWDVSVPHETPGDLNVCIAARDICIYCSAQSTQGLARLREIAKDLEQRSPQNFISTQILRRARGRWSIVGSATSPA